MLAVHFAITHNAGLQIIQVVSQMRSVFAVRSVIGWSLLHYAIFYKMPLEVVKYLYRNYPEAVNSPCLYKINSAHAECGETYFDDVHDETESHIMVPGANTPLGLALDMNRQQFTQNRKMPSNVEVILFLLDKSVNVYLVPDSNGDIAFHKLLKGEYTPDAHLTLINAFAEKHTIHGQGAPFIHDTRGNLLVDLAICLYLPKLCFLAVFKFTIDQIVSLVADGICTMNLRAAPESESARFRLFKEGNCKSGLSQDFSRLVHSSGLPVRILSNGDIPVSETTFDYFYEHRTKTAESPDDTFSIMTQYVMTHEVAVKHFKNIAYFIDHAFQTLSPDPNDGIEAVKTLLVERIRYAKDEFAKSPIGAGKTHDDIRKELISLENTHSSKETKHYCGAVLRAIAFMPEDGGFVAINSTNRAENDTDNAAEDDDDIPGPAAGTSKNGVRKRRQREKRARERDEARKAVEQAEAGALRLEDDAKREAQLSEDAIIMAVAQDILSNVIEAVEAEDVLLRTVQAKNITKVALLLYPHVDLPPVLDTEEEDDVLGPKSVPDASAVWKVSDNFLRAVAVLQPSVAPSKPSLQKQAELQQQVDTLTDLIEDLNCTVCHAERRNVFIAPCMHLCVCQDCIGVIVECPICRGVIGSHQMVFT